MLAEIATCINTVSQNTTFMRPAIGTDVVAKGRLIKAGRTLIFGEVSLISADNQKTICTGQLTYAVINSK